MSFTPRQTNKQTDKQTKCITLLSERESSTFHLHVVQERLTLLSVSYTAVR